MKKTKIKSVIIYFIVFAAILVLWKVASNGTNTNYEKDGDAVYYYFPAEYEEGYYPFRQIRSKERDGAKIEYHGKSFGKHLYDSSAAEYTNVLNNISFASASSSSEVVNNLYGGYYPDGRLASVIYNDANSYDTYEVTGYQSTQKYLMMKFYDEDGKRAKDFAELCGEAYADDIAKSISISYPNERVSRIFVVCSCDDVGTYYIAAYISDNETEFDKELCERVYLLSAGGIECGNYLRAIIFSDGANTDNMRIAAEKAAELLNDGYSDIINKANSFEAVAVIDNF